VALLIFGKRLPEVCRSIGKGLMEFRRGMQDIQDEIRSSIESDLSDDVPPPLDSHPDKPEKQEKD